MNTATDTRRVPGTKSAATPTIALPAYRPTLRELAAILETALDKFVIAAALMTNADPGQVIESLGERWAAPLKPYIVEKVLYVRCQRDEFKDKL